MVRLNYFALALLVFLSSPAAAAWQYRADRDPFTDERASSASLVKPGLFAGALVVRCKSGLIEAYVMPGEYLGSDDVSVRVRFDKAPPEERKWSIATSGKGAFSDVPVEFARKVIAHSLVVVELTDFAGVAHLERFSLAGSSGPVSRVLSDCALMSEDPRALDENIWRRVVQDVDELDVETAGNLGRALNTLFGEWGSHRDRRDLILYRSMSRFYEAYWSLCESGKTDTASCKTYRDRLSRDPSADYPTEATELLVEYFEAAKNGDGSDD